MIRYQDKKEEARRGGVVPAYTIWDASDAVEEKMHALEQIDEDLKLQNHQVKALEKSLERLYQKHNKHVRNHGRHPSDFAELLGDRATWYN
ncbi:hypothetical protein FGADI_463 [Fusarium gaditjirri]|uniref:Uncharacterized protein n=1 Tax=Fusarium gaditjirri TaxID=282569 RepID=A0A8H4TNL3_9HYPO|nr:hypothetical protein FGADI_463 [Fusarium gaditjirri]